MSKLNLTIEELLEDLPPYTEALLYKLPKGVYYTDTMEYLLLIEELAKSKDINILNIIAVKNANFTMQYYNTKGPDFLLNLIGNNIRLLKIYITLT
jgi:uncharacterized membrane protein YukC